VFAAGTCAREKHVKNPRPKGKKKKKRGFSGRISFLVIFSFHSLQSSFPCVCVCLAFFFSLSSLFSFLEKMNVGAPLTPVSPAPHLRQETRAAPTLTLSSSFFFLSFSLFFFPPFT
jgi:hypothetical protein